MSPSTNHLPIISGVMAMEEVHQRSADGEDERPAERRRGAVTLRRAVLAGCAVMAIAAVAALAQEPAPGSTRTALLSASFPGGTLFGGPANWGRFLAAGGMVVPAGAGGGAPVSGSRVVRLQRSTAPELAVPSNAAVLGLLRAPANYGSQDASQLWPSTQQLTAAIAAGGGAGSVIAAPPAPALSPWPASLSGLPASLLQGARVSATRGSAPWDPIGTQERAVEGGGAIAEPAVPQVLPAAPLQMAPPPPLSVWGILPQAQVTQQVTLPRVEAHAVRAKYDCLGGGGERRSGLLQTVEPARAAEITAARCDAPI